MNGQEGTIGRGELRLVLTGVMLALTLAALDQNIVATALPRVVSDLGGLTALSWVVTAFLMASTTTAPLYGKLSDIHGRKPAFVVSILIFLLGSALCGAAGGMTQLIAFRALQGVGAGGLMTLSQAALGDVLTPRERGRYQGLLVGVFAICSVAGPLLGGVITDLLSWRWIFYVNLPVGAVALAAILAGLKAGPARPGQPVDVAGGVLLMAATAGLLLLLSSGGAVYPWDSRPMILLSGLAVAAVAVLILVERRAKGAIMPPHLFANPIFLFSTAAMALAMMALYAAMVFMPLFAQLVLGRSPTAAGMMLAPLMGGVIVSSILGGRLVSATGRYKALTAAGLAAAAAALGVLSRDVFVGGAFWVMEAALVVIGLGIGCANPNLTTAIQNAVPREDLGAATAVSVYFRSLGGALGVALGGAILAVGLRHSLPPGLMAGEGTALEGLDRILSLPASEQAAVLAAYRQALGLAFGVGVVLALLAMLFALLAPERRLKGKSRKA